MSWSRCSRSPESASTTRFPACSWPLRSMRPKTPAAEPTEDPLRLRLERTIDPRNELVRLAEFIDRSRFETRARRTVPSLARDADDPDADDRAAALPRARLRPLRRGGRSALDGKPVLPAPVWRGVLPPRAADPSDDDDAPATAYRGDGPPVAVDRDDLGAEAERSAERGRTSTRRCRRRTSPIPPVGN